MTAHVHTIETHLSGDVRYSCSCGDKGLPTARTSDAMAHHRLHLDMIVRHRWLRPRHRSDGMCGRCGKPKPNPVHLQARGGKP